MPLPTTLEVRAVMRDAGHGDTIYTNRYKGLPADVRRVKCYGNNSNPAANQKLAKKLKAMGATNVTITSANTSGYPYSGWCGIIADARLEN